MVVICEVSAKKASHDLDVTYVNHILVLFKIKD